jgi:hypothetical protein
MMSLPKQFMYAKNKKSKKRPRLGRFSTKP